ncbi:Lactate utilization protein A [Peribacillus sp. Bi96]|uniref:(Fe-S)-binding protein n=1 Tax=Peribacillus sp. Bi96 TaxID=2884273 RepID=UPI001DFDABC3|nr:(Fe-S)-binding protein [Peribacillus sp. Bi96]CAH0156172.1 Lactate utilization protein A [Peribacillus sp. Bi96]
MNLPVKSKETNAEVQNLYSDAYDWTNQCVKCGYCLPACPTYESMGVESASPRGRINLVKMAAEGKIDFQKDLAQPIDLCLGCRACETACPVGVPYGHILEAAKEAIENSQPANQKNKMTKMKKLALVHLFPFPKRMNRVGSVVHLYQKTGLSKLIRRSNVLQKVSPALAHLEQALPTTESSSKRIRKGTIIPAKGETKLRVAFFTGCIMDSMMSRINRLTIELLTLVGCEVILPENQNCCGALHSHQGETKQAKELAKSNIRAFMQAEADVIVNNAGGCGASLLEYEHLLANEHEWSGAARDFSKKSKDISQILYQLGPLPFTEEWQGVVSYQDSCHLRNVQKVQQEPRSLLQSIPGISYVEMEGYDRCCASGGIYNLLHFDESMKILDEKMRNLKETKATTIVTVNPGCQMQMSIGIQREGAAANQIKSMHLVEILAKACGLD